ncbi:MAG: T9SS type A sorting domain-containing protein [Flavobacterium sp.]|nr:T9SS type A sorting domain-containing protein [Flavobacterium sp.]MBP8156973.1 T9SS type A sorting domain-containing protein [Flavobacterium sp.]
MKKITLLFLICITNSYAQFIVNTTHTDLGNHFVYNGNLYFSNNLGSSYTFSKYDGTTVTPISNPSGVTGIYQSDPILFNGDFYFKFSGNFLAKYNGTNLAVIDKVLPTDIGLSSPPVVYNSKLTYVYRGGNNSLRQLATYDGNVQTIYPNPDSATSAYSYFLAEYNGEAYYSYVNASGNTSLVKFNGTSVSLIPNPNSAEWGIYSGNACVVNNKLIFLYQTADAKVHFASYDGNTITVVPNLLPTDDFVFSTLISFDNAVYGKYRDSSGKFHIAKYDGTIMTVLSNIDAADLGYTDSPFIYNDKLYFRYRNAASSYWLARTDGYAIELLTHKFMGGYGNPNGYALEVGGNVYFKTQSSAGFTTLGKFDGTDLTTYGNVGNTNPELGTNELVFYNSKIHFLALNGNDEKLSYLDQVILDNERYNSNDFKVYPNPSNGQFTIQITTEMLGATVEIYNLLGQKIKSLELFETETQQYLNHGLYIVSITKNNIKITQKLAIE